MHVACFALMADVPVKASCAAATAANRALAAFAGPLVLSSACGQQSARWVTANDTVSSAPRKPTDLLHDAPPADLSRNHDLLASLWAGPGGCEGVGSGASARRDCGAAQHTGLHTDKRRFSLCVFSRHSDGSQTSNLYPSQEVDKEPA